MGQGDLAGAARLQLVSGVVHLRPEDAMFEAMLQGWRAQQMARGIAGGDDRAAGAAGAPVPGVHQRVSVAVGSAERGGVDAVADRGVRHLAPSTIRGYQTDLRLFSEYLCDARYGWAAACERAFGSGVHPVPICHEWNTIAHLNDYEGNPEARPFTREELQRFLDYADDQVERAVRAKRKGALAAYRDATLFKDDLWVGAAPHRDLEAGCGGLGPQPGGAGVRPVRDAARALRQGGARAAATATQRAVGDGVGGGGGGRLRGEHPAPVRLRRIIRHCG